MPEMSMRVGRLAGMLLGVAFAMMLAVLIAVLVMQWQRGRNPKPLDGSKMMQFAQGTFTVTGVSDRPDHGDTKGERFCTVSGTITGPQTQPTEVYGTLVFGEHDPWPQVGVDMPVIFKPGKTESSWQFGTLPPIDGPPGPPQAPPPA